MAILDTLITQLTQGAFSLAPAALHIHNNITDKEQNSANLHNFRQDVMGAMALFTGGHSLTDLHKEDAYDISNALDTLIEHLNTPAHNITTSSLGAHQLRPSLTPDHTARETIQSHNIHITTPAITRSLRPSSTAETKRRLSPTQQDWSVLLSRSEPHIQRALREVEPSLHNIQRTFAHIVQLRTHPALSSPVSPIPALQSLSALATTRGILFATSPRPSGSIASTYNAVTTDVKPSRPHSRPSDPSSPMAFPSGLRHIKPRKAISPSTITMSLPAQHAPMQRLHQLERIISHSISPPSDEVPYSPLSLHTPPSLMTLTHQFEAATTPRRTTTHHTTTHSPNVHITVHAAQGSPDNLAHMIEESTVKSLTRHTLFRTG